MNPLLTGIYILSVGVGTTGRESISKVPTPVLQEETSQSIFPAPPLDFHIESFVRGVAGIAADSDGRIVRGLRTRFCMFLPVSRAVPSRPAADPHPPNS